jgi:WD40 repeat protein
MKVSDVMNYCPNCGRAVSPGASEGLCAPCLIEGVLSRGVMERPMVEEEGVDALHVLGPYRLLEQIGRGGMGIVFRACREGSDVEVAVKVIAAGSFAAPEEVRRFRLEAEAAQKLIHPNIVRIFDSGEEQGRHYFAMDLASGGNLAEMIGKSARMRSSDVAALLVKVARGVQFAHERGILHRDLKPENILLTGDGEPKIGDFGLAKLDDKRSGNTLAGTLLGTPGYMPPELARGGASQATTAADVYSLGAILYHALEGRPPFDGETAVDVLRQVEFDEPTPLDCDRDLAMICMKCLEKSPSGRYASAGALADDLDRWLDGEPIHARPISGLERARRWVRRRPVLATALGLVSVAGIVLATVMVVGTVMLRRERDVARALAAQVVDEAGRAERSHELVRQNLYAADMFLASKALEEGNLGVARACLARHLHSSLEDDQRGFEWYEMERRCRGDERQVIDGHSAAVTAVAISPKGDRIATASRDQTIRISDLSTGGTVISLPKEDAPAGLPELLLLTRLVAKSAEAREMLLSGEKSMDEIRMMARPGRGLGEFTAIDWSNDGKWLATGSNFSFVRIWNAANWSLESIVPVSMCAQLAFTPDDSALVVATHGEIGGVRVYDLKSLDRVVTHEAILPCFALSGDGSKIAVVTLEERLELRDLKSGAVEWSIHVESGTRRIAMSPDGRMLALLAANGSKIVFVDVYEERILSAMDVSPGSLRTLEFSKDGSRLVCAGGDQKLRVFDTGRREELRSLQGHEDEVLTLAFAENGSFVTGGNDHSARIWSLSGDGAGDVFVDSTDVRYEATGMLPFLEKGFAKPVLSPNGDRVLALRWPRTLGVWDSASGECLAKWQGSDGTIEAFLFSPDSNRVVSAGDDNLISVWDAASGERIQSLHGHKAPVLALAFAEDGRTLASSARDRTVRLWHVPTWRELGVLREGELVSALHFEGGGARLVLDRVGGNLRVVNAH